MNLSSYKNSKFISIATSFAIATAPFLISGCGGAESPPSSPANQPPVVANQNQDTQKQIQELNGRIDELKRQQDAPKIVTIEQPPQEEATAAEACVRGGTVGGGALVAGTVIFVALDCLFMMCANTIVGVTAAAIAAPKVIGGACIAGIVDNAISPLKGKEPKVIIVKPVEPAPANVPTPNGNKSSIELKEAAPQ